MPLIVDASNMAERMTAIDQLIAMQTDIAGDHIAEEDERHTFPYVPAEQHYLENTFEAVQNIGSGFTSSSGLGIFSLIMTYDAVSNKGFHYGEMQHELRLNHFGPEKKFIKPGAVDHFMLKGTAEVDALVIWGAHLASVL